MTGSCSKKAHKSRNEAERAKISLYKRSNRRLRSYFCDLCHFWHLTTTEKFKKRGRKPVILYEYEHRFREGDR